MDIALNIISSAINLGTLIVSIIVFINTIKKTEKEHYIISFRESLHSFLEKTDKFFREIDPQDYFDNCSVIYSGNEFNYPDIYAEIKRRNSKITYVCQELLLYKPNDEEIFDIIARLLYVLKDKATYINNVFCEDIKLLMCKQKDNISFDRIDHAMTDYSSVYEDIVKIVFNGLHVMQESVVTKNKEKIEEFKRLYGKKYINEV